MPEAPTAWKGVLNNGKTGLFNPAHTVSYLGNILPSIKPQFSRGGKSLFTAPHYKSKKTNGF
jgi:activated CDC42 kinase 1